MSRRCYSTSLCLSFFFSNIWTSRVVILTDLYFWSCTYLVCCAQKSLYCLRHHAIAVLTDLKLNDKFICIHMYIQLCTYLCMHSCSHVFHSTDSSGQRCKHLACVLLSWKEKTWNIMQQVSSAVGKVEILVQLRCSRFLQCNIAIPTMCVWFCLCVRVCGKRRPTKFPIPNHVSITLVVLSFQKMIWTVCFSQPQIS